MKGGVFAKEEDLDIFLEKCKISYFTSGAYGFVFLVESETSPYFSVRNGVERKINKMIIKLCAISNYHSYKLSSIINTRNYSVKTVSERSFEREIEIQTEVFFRTSEYLNPICPCIIHSEIKIADFDYVDPERLHRKRLAPRLSHLLSKTVPESIGYNILKLFLDQILSGQLSMYGLICMEYADGYETLHTIYKTHPKPIKLIEEYQTVARYKLIQMTLKTQYTHSDFHYGNILCKDGDVLLIDFGLSNKLDHEKWYTLKEECDSHSFYDALESIFYPLRYDSYDLRNNMDDYGWLLGTDQIEDEDDKNEDEDDEDDKNEDDEDEDDKNEDDEDEDEDDKNEDDKNEDDDEDDDEDVDESIKSKINKEIEIVVENQNLKIQKLKEMFPGRFPLTKKERQKFYQFKKEAPPRYIRNQYQIQGPEAIIPQSTRVSRLYNKRVHKRTKSLNRYTHKKGKKNIRTKSLNKISREPRIIFHNQNQNERGSAVPRGTRR